MDPIYLDNNASTQPDPLVVEAMMPWLGSAHANPHSSHLAGQKAAAAVERASHEVADLIGAQPNELVFTSGATEANNLALRGLIEEKPKNSLLLHSTIEHRAIFDVGRYLQSLGTDLRLLPVNKSGLLELSSLQTQLTGGEFETKLVSIIHANNEIGVIQPIENISNLTREAGALLHVDSAQSVGKIEIDVMRMGIDLLSLSSHKIYGPSGIGAIYIAPHLKNKIRPLILGGGQQRGLRSGTLPAFLIVGFGAACSIAKKRMHEDEKQVELYAEIFCRALQERGVAFDVFNNESRLPGLRSIRFRDIYGHDLVMRVSSQLSISTGSACSSWEIQSSHVLQAVGFSSEEANRVVRVGFGRFSTATESRSAAEIIANSIAQAEY